jgi:hypothetical protein
LKGYRFEGLIIRTSQPTHLRPHTRPLPLDPARSLLLRVGHLNISHAAARPLQDRVGITSATARALPARVGCLSTPLAAARAISVTQVGNLSARRHACVPRRRPPASQQRAAAPPSPLGSRGTLFTYRLCRGTLAQSITLPRGFHMWLHICAPRLVGGYYAAHASPKGHQLVESLTIPPPDHSTLARSATRPHLVVGLRL